jgi:uncharacterized membrane protein SpoIIM required for sporulation
MNVDQKTDNSAMRSLASQPNTALRSSVFRRGREANWRALEYLVDKAERNGIGALDGDELRRLPLLYRATLSSLSVARSIVLDRALLQYLESLGLRAFLVVYGPPLSLLEALRNFLLQDFPQRVRKSGKYVFLAFAAVLVGGILGFIVVVGDESLFNTVVPADLIGDRGAESSRDDLLQNEIFAPWPGVTQSFVVFANFLFRHNTLVGILTFTLGILAGVPTMVLLVYQGLTFGAFAAIHYNRGLLLDFLGWVSIHGVTEFSAIILCGAGGLMIAETVLVPGRHSRLDNLALRGGAAAQLVVGAVVMFFLAGLIEGGLRQLVANTLARFAIAGLTAVLWLFYLLEFSRGQDQ